MNIDGLSGERCIRDVARTADMARLYRMNKDLYYTLINRSGSYIGNLVSYWLFS